MPFALPAVTRIRGAEAFAGCADSLTLATGKAVLTCYARENPLRKAICTVTVP